MVTDSTGGIGTDECFHLFLAAFYGGEAFDGNLLAQVGYSYDRETMALPSATAAYIGC